MFTTRPEIAGTFGVVASTHWIASQVGMAVLERGGNAFDAAVATAFTLQVAEPHLNGPGGDAPIILHSARTQTQHVICGQGVAPQAATLAKFRELDIDLIPGDRRAAGGGARRVRRLVPAAARLGHLGTRRRAGLRHRLREERHPRRAAHHRDDREHARRCSRPSGKSSAAVFLPGGKVPGPESLFARPALADTYERICREAVGDTREARIDAARGAWYRGFVAEAVDRFFRSTDVLDVTGRRHRGLLAADDFAALVGDGRGPGRLRLPRPHRAEMRPVEPGAGVPATARPAARLRHRRDGSVRHRLRPHRGGVRQARLRRSRGLLRRSQFLPRAARRVVVGRIQCRTPQAGRAQRVAGAASRHGGRLRAGRRSRRRRPRASADPRRRASASRPWRGWA